MYVCVSSAFVFGSVCVCVYYLSIYFIVCIYTPIHIYIRSPVILLLLDRSKSKIDGALVVS